MKDYNYFNGVQWDVKIEELNELLGEFEDYVVSIFVIVALSHPITKNKDEYQNIKKNF